VLDATTDRDTIRGWWTDHPDANVAIRTGEASGLVVLDIDPDKDGASWLARFLAEHGPFPETTRVLTGGGGEHWYFEHPGIDIANSAGKIAPGVDIRGENGYVIAPPSAHVSGGSYRYDDSPASKELRLAPVPEALLQLIRSRQVLAPASSGTDPIPEGTRNTTLASIAGRLRRAGCDEATIFAALCDINQKRCIPPLADDEVAKVARSISRHAPVDPVGDDADGADGNERNLGGGPVRPSGVDQVLEIVSDAELFHTELDEPWATVIVGDHREHWSINSSRFRKVVERQYYQAHGSVPSDKAWEYALSLLGGRALYDGPKRAVAIRVAGHDGRIYIDLVDPSWHAVEIDANGWRVVSNPPVIFRRAPGAKELPEPRPGGSLDLLWQSINLPDPEGRQLVLAWLISAYRPTGPFPVLGLNGEQGSAKTTASKMLVALVDPRVPDVRSMPRGEENLIIAANGAWCLAFDNLSQIPTGTSDVLCRISTGAGFATRQLYTNTEEVIFSVCRPVLLNGIGDVVSKPDLLDRLFQVTLSRIEDTARRTEAEVWEAFEANRPLILGALLDAVSCALRELPNTTLAELPRMADVALWVTAAEPALGWAPGAFMSTYFDSRAAANEVALEASPIGAVIRRLVQREDFRGTATQLLAQINNLADDRERQQGGYPHSPQAMGNAIRQIAPNLRGVGIEVETARKGHGGTRLTTLRLVNRDHAALIVVHSSSPSSATSAQAQHADNTMHSADMIPIHADSNTHNMDDESCLGDEADGSDDDLLMEPLTINWILEDLITPR